MNTANDTVAELTRMAGEAMAQCFRAAPQFEARVGGHSSLVLTGQPVTDFNYLIVGPEADPEATFREGMAAVKSRSLPVLVMFAPHVADRLGKLAGDLGLAPAGEFPLMVLHKGAPLEGSEGFRVEQISNAAGLRDAVSLWSQAFSFPLDETEKAFGPGVLRGLGIAVFIAYKGSDPYSVVMSTRSGDTVGIWAMGTPPERQRKGSGRALLVEVINRLSEQGAERFYLGATPAGYRLYESLGFETISSWKIWALGESTQTE